MKSDRTASLQEIVNERLADLVDDLEPGERIVIKTIEKCGCDVPRMSPNQKTCHICNGNEFVVDANTILPSGDDGD